MNNRLFISLSLLANIAGQLNTLEFNEAWKADDNGERAGLFADEDLLTLAEGVVHSTLDENDRFLFIVNHKGTINLVQEVGDRIEDGTLTQMSFEGSEVVAAVLETAVDGGGVTLGNLAAFFVFFGPEAVGNMLTEMVAEADRIPSTGGPKLEGTSLEDSNRAETIAEVRSISPKSADLLESMQTPSGDTHPNIDRVEMMVREPRTIFLDTGWKKVGALGVLGLAAYGVFRLCRS